MLISWTDSMVTRWRLIKSPWVRGKLPMQTLTEKNESTKKEATKININKFSSSITLSLPTNTLSLYAHRGLINWTAIDFLSSVNRRFGPTKQ